MSSQLCEGGETWQNFLPVYIDHPPIMLSIATKWRVRACHRYLSVGKEDPIPFKQAKKIDK